MSDDREYQAERDVGRFNAFFPILPHLGNQWAVTRPWEGLTVGLNLHLTTLTAALIRELTLGGARCVVSAANPATTDAGTVALIRDLGAEVHTGGDLEDPRAKVLDEHPQLLVDVGFELIRTLLVTRPEQISEIRGAVEITRTGITKLRQHGAVPFPVVNINDGRLKDSVENRHGVGEALWKAVGTLTGMHLAGRRLAVVGYGPVGRGLALYAKASGMNVEVVETDAIRRLFAHYDGFPTPTLANALTRVGILVTATGHRRVVGMDNLLAARDGIVLVNAGHGGDEIDIDSLKRGAERIEHIHDNVIRYRLENGTRVVVLGNGHPLNIVLNSGSPEPVLLHYAVLGLTLERVAAGGLPPGEIVVPEEIEARAAALALEALSYAVT